MKLFELTKPDFFNYDSPAESKIANELDAFTASPNVRLKQTTIEFLRNKYKNRTGSVTLYRAMVFDDLAIAKRVLGTDVKSGTKFTYRRDKESSWTKSKSFAYSFAENGDLDEQYTIVLRAVVPEKDFLFDVADLSKKDLEHIVLEDQSEVIVNADNREVVIDKVIDNFSD
jgi:hypothetical protein